MMMYMEKLVRPAHAEISSNRLAAMRAIALIMLTLWGVIESNSSAYAKERLASSQAEGPSIACTKRDGFIAGPAVPTAAVAKQIYVAIARGLYPHSWRKYPIIFVLDERDKWGISQRKSGSGVKSFQDKSDREMETVRVDRSVGVLEMDIDKCEATVSMSFAR
jgi:hypothetical protein